MVLDILLFDFWYVCWIVLFLVIFFIFCKFNVLGLVLLLIGIKFKLFGWMIDFFVIIIVDFSLFCILWILSGYLCVSMVWIVGFEKFFVFVLNFFWYIFKKVWVRSMMFWFLLWSGGIKIGIFFIW